ADYVSSEPGLTVGILLHESIGARAAKDSSLNLRRCPRLIRGSVLKVDEDHGDRLCAERIGKRPSRRISRRRACDARAAGREHRAAIRLLSAVDMDVRAGKKIRRDRKSTRLNSSHGSISYA